VGFNYEPRVDIRKAYETSKGFSHLTRCILKDAKFAKKYPELRDSMAEEQVNGQSKHQLVTFGGILMEIARLLKIELTKEEQPYFVGEAINEARCANQHEKIDPWDNNHHPQMPLANAG
jgi:hypothetical protein